MQKHILFIQGGGDDAYTFDQGLVSALTREFDSSWHIHYPPMPNESNPDYLQWKKEIEQRLKSFEGVAILVGHSIGASVILKYLCDTPEILPQAVLAIATPYWHNDKFWSWPEVALPVDAGLRMSTNVPLFLYHSKDDPTVPVAHFHELARLLPRATTRLFETGGHQCEMHVQAIAKDIEDAIAIVNK